MPKSFFKGLSRGTILLTFTSFFADIATEMLYPVLPIFLTQVIAAPASIVGIVEGAATAAQNIIQGFSGWISDKTKSPKKIALVGYGLAAISKPLIGLSGSWPQVIFWRTTDRLGTGVRSAPRDALIASSATAASRGRAFGLEGAGDNLGAFLGPLISVFLLFSLHLDIQTIFYLTFIPAALAFFTVFLVSSKSTIKSETKKPPFSIKSLSKNYWKYLLTVAIFGLGNLSSAFIILQAKNIGLSTEVTILIYAFFNLAAAITSFPVGVLSDKLGRKNLLIFCFVIFIITFLGFANNKSFSLMAGLFLLYGIFQGTFRSVGKATAVDLVPAHLKASGVGWYSTVVGLSGFLASTIAGQLWVRINPSATFYYGAILGFLALIFLFFTLPSKLQKS